MARVEGASEHPVGVGRLGGYRLHNVPVLDDPPVLDAEDVHHRLPEVVREHFEVVVQDDEVVLGDGSLEVERRLRRLSEEAADEVGEDLAAVRSRRVVLLVLRAQVALGSLRGLALDEGEIEEVNNEALGLLRASAQFTTLRSIETTAVIKTVDPVSGIHSVQSSRGRLRGCPRIVPCIAPLSEPVGCGLLPYARSS